MHNKPVVPNFVCVRLMCYLLMSGFVLYFRPEVTAFLTSLFGQEQRVGLMLFFLFFQGMFAYAVAVIIHILLGLLLWRIFIKK